jgi:hypothetical protein
MSPTSKELPVNPNGDKRGLKITLVALLALHFFHARVQGGGGWNTRHKGLLGAIWKFFDLSFKDPVLSAGLSDFAVVATLCGTWMYQDLPVQDRHRPRTYVWLTIFVLFPGLGALLYPLWIRPGARATHLSRA